LDENNTEPTLERLKKNWNKVIYESVPTPSTIRSIGGLFNLTKKWNKPIIFTELGFCSGACPTGKHLDLEYQLTHYKAVFEIFKNEPWFGGVFWWNWNTDPNFGGDSDVCNTPQFKPAEATIRKYFGGSGESIKTGNAICACIVHNSPII
jgi:hypothetical protein